MHAYKANPNSLLLRNTLPMIVESKTPFVESPIPRRSPKARIRVTEGVMKGDFVGCSGNIVAVAVIATYVIRPITTADVLIPV